MTCPDANTLTEYLEGAASPEVAVRVEAHADACPSCRVVIADMSAARSRSRGGLSLAVGNATEAAAGASARRQGILSQNTPVGRYLVLEPIGIGGMGVVYLAHDPELGRRVAIKVLHTDHADDAHRFEREARILSEIDDPRIVRHVAHGALPSGEQYLVMEWLDGEDLASRLARGRLGVAEGVALCIDVAQALAALHERGIVHRDLKPGNLFLVDGRTDQVRLLDFGLAHVEASTRTTGTGVLVGTLAYMAPEQAKGTKEIDARADVFALGCVLFECLAGEPAFTGDHAMSILAKILFEDTPRLGDRCRGVPHDLAALVDRLLSKDPAARPRHGRAVVEALVSLGELPVGTLSATARAVRPTSLTDSEQRALAVILISAPAAPADLSEADDAWFEAEAEVHGATFARLLDGSRAALLSGGSVATDLAARAARCALAFGRRSAARRVALTVGRGRAGPAIDRAALLLGQHATIADTTSDVLITLDDTVVGLLDARFDVRDESGVYVLAGQREIAEVRTLLGKPTPCVGRERELRTLEGLFADCVGDDGGAQVVLVTAQPGVGKSRLGYEFLQHVRRRGEPLSVWIARCEPLRAGSAFGLTSDLVRSAATIRGGEPLEVRQERLRTQVANNVPESERTRVTEFLGELIGAPFPGEDSLPLRAARNDAELMSDQVRAAFLDFVAAECDANPVLVVLEDLHWGDAPTVRLLDCALRALEEKPLFVLALARPEVHDAFPSLWSECPVQELRIRELNRRAAERLSRHVLGERTNASVVSRIVDLAEGNAFYLEELIRAVKEGRGDDLPETVVAMVQSRLGVLDDQDRRVLRAASVFGETFWASGVCALLGVVDARAAGVEDRLRALAARELVQKRRESRFPGETEYAFRHALLREGAYALLTDDDRTLGHGLAGGWLEQRGEDDPQVLAEHFEKGDEGGRAAAQWLRASDRAGMALDAASAIHHAERGLACREGAEVRSRLLGALCQHHCTRMERLADARAYADELLAASERGSAPWVQAMLVEITLAASEGNMDAFARALREIMSADIESDGMDAAGLALGTGAYLLERSGSIREATAVVDSLALLARAAAHRAPGVGLLYHSFCAVTSAYARQDPWAGLGQAQIALEQSRAVGHPKYIPGATLFAAMNSWFLGAYAEAKSALLDMGAAAVNLSTASSIPPFVLAWLLADAGSIAEARDWATRLVASGQTRSLALDQARGHWALANVHRIADDFDAAEREIQTALSMIREACPLDVPGVLATLAALRLAQGRPTEALAATEEGMDRYEAMGACSQFFRDAYLRLVHAECLKATGNHDAAKAAIGEARDYLFMVEARIGDPAYRKTFLEAVPENRRILELAALWIGDHGAVDTTRAAPGADLTEPI